LREVVGLFVEVLLHLVVKLALEEIRVVAVISCSDDYDCDDFALSLVAPIVKVLRGLAL